MAKKPPKRGPKRPPTSKAKSAKPKPKAKPEASSKPKAEAKKKDDKADKNRPTAFTDKVVTKDINTLNKAMQAELVGMEMSNNDMARSCGVTATVIGSIKDGQFRDQKQSTFLKLLSLVGGTIIIGDAEIAYGD